jgi:hypothetical protein
MGATSSVVASRRSFRSCGWAASEMTTNEGTFQSGSGQQQEGELRCNTPHHDAAQCVGPGDQNAGAATVGGGHAFFWGSASVPVLDRLMSAVL